MKTYLSPLGFDTSHIVSLIVTCGIERGDRICLIRPGYGEDARAERAIDDVRAMSQKISGDIRVDVLKIASRSIEDMTLMIMDEICASTPPVLPEGNLIVNLSGGPREVLVALNTATLVLSSHIHQCAIFSDITREIETYMPPRLPLSFDERTLQILADIAMHNPTSISEIAERVQVSESTASRVCAKLASEEMIQIQQEKRSKIVTLQFSGKIMLKAGGITLSDLSKVR
ncbi:CRISPR locus-related DNA-binding protein [Methanofollis aquaemaris]|uniref:CRISPR locus-related DNA-binding protein n=1 Tax=Methanofollis aquaemaris TaxID=126734 RepID=A0A8A3S934_9EURY|nr:CRISPR-associated CARF protein Csa3 [Methanofollis aquaemaris]QSZ68144.1 CRISPR locus-related DNA-binding protein [Methanofollis aquaemaris]